jgi:hypothetical protein
LEKVGRIDLHACESRGIDSLLDKPPHVHIKGTDFAAKVRISNGDLLAGEAPIKVLKQARRWVEGRREQLLAMWDEFQR